MTTVSRLKVFKAFTECPPDIYEQDSGPSSPIEEIFKKKLIDFAEKKSEVWTCAKACVECCAVEFVRDDYRFKTGSVLREKFYQVLGTIHTLDPKRIKEISECFENSLNLRLENKWIAFMGSAFLQVICISDKQKRFNAAKQWGVKFQSGLYCVFDLRGRGFNAKNIQSTLVNVSHAFGKLLRACEKQTNDLWSFNEMELQSLHQMVVNNVIAANGKEFCNDKIREGNQLMDGIAAAVFFLHTYKEALKGKEEDLWRKILSDPGAEFKTLVKTYRQKIVSKQI